MQKKPNRQAIRSRKMLQEALIELVQECDFSSLRVQDITDRANLGRATFYLHYADKEDLLTAIVDQSYQDLVGRLDLEGQNEGLIGLKWAMEYARENPDLFRVVMGHQRTVKRMKSLIVGRVSAVLQENESNGVVVDASAHILAGAILGVFDWWQMQKETLSIDELLALFSKIISADYQNIKHH